MLTQDKVDLLRVCQYSIDALTKNNLAEAADPLYHVLTKTLVAAIGMDAAEHIIDDNAMGNGLDPVGVIEEYVGLIGTFGETFDTEIPTADY